MKQLNEYAEMDAKLRLQSERLKNKVVEWGKFTEYLQTLVKELNGVNSRDS